jgi:hypothetical protein
MTFLQQFDLDSLKLKFWVLMAIRNGWSHVVGQQHYKFGFVHVATMGLF